MCIYSRSTFHQNLFLLRKCAVDNRSINSCFLYEKYSGIAVHHALHCIGIPLTPWLLNGITLQKSMKNLIFAEKCMQNHKFLTNGYNMVSDNPYLPTKRNFCHTVYFLHKEMKGFFPRNTSNFPKVSYRFWNKLVSHKSDETREEKHCKETVENIGYSTIAMAID